MVRREDGAVSYLQVHFWPGGTEDQYRAMIDVIHPESGLPDGQRSRTSGPTQGGYLISVIWDSKDQSEAFMRDTLLPALPVEGGRRRARRAHRRHRPPRRDLNPTHTHKETCMFVTVIHKIHDPEGFQAAEAKALEAGLPTHVALPIHAATNDHTLGICIWEGDSVDAVREVVEGAVGPWAENEYYEMNVDGLAPSLGG
jgi:hypothetical protein